jgi:MFS superfamily sulfate permease-like transporter
MQIVMGAIRAGGVARLFPKPVVIGMLVAIGIILILKQVPHALGYSGDFEGDQAFFQADGRNTFTEIPFALGHFNLGATILTLLGGTALYLSKRTRLSKLRWLPGPLLAVGIGMLVNAAFSVFAPELAVGGALLVEIPEGGVSSLTAQLTTPEFALITDGRVWVAAFGIALIASIETLLCTEAVDAQDPLNRHTPPNRELLAQGVGNVLCGLVGGIPVTAVIVRGSANVNSGAKSRMSAVMHGLWLLIAVLALAPVMNMIPLAALASVLLMVGFNLASPKRLREMLTAAPATSVPFATTVLVTLFSDLLAGVVTGFVVSAGFLCYEVARVRRAGRTSDSVTFKIAHAMPWLTSAALRSAMPKDGRMEIDASNLDEVPQDLRTAIDGLKSEFGERIHLPSSFPKANAT